MAIASPSTPAFSPSLGCTRTKLSRLARSPEVLLTQSRRNRTRRLVVSLRLNSSKSSDAGGFISPDNGDASFYELQHDFSPQRRRSGLPVFVTLPVDALNPEGRVRRPKAMKHSLYALAKAGVEGVVIEIWWGLVERNEPRVYNWQGYWELVMLAWSCGLKVRAVLAFHQCGTGPGDPNWIPLPLWVLDEIKKNPELSYSDRFGRRNFEYISLGCDMLPVLRGRSPIQAYADFMRDFRNAFRPYLGVIITGVQVGMGPGGELRYPSCTPSQKLQWAWPLELGEFQCYDKYMIASLNACAREMGMHEWGNGGPIGTGNLMQSPELNQFLRTDVGSWNAPYGNFFLECYLRMLVLHGERICREADTIFRDTEVNISTKVALFNWNYNTQSHPSELTAGYYNTLYRDGYLPIARMFSKYGFTMCCSYFEIQDPVVNMITTESSPKGLFRQILLAARLCDLPLDGENFSSNLDDKAFDQLLKMSKFYSDGIEKRPFSFNFVRMDRNLFEPRYWSRFTRFVKQMADGNVFRARLSFASNVRLKPTSRAAAEVGLSYQLA